MDANERVYFSFVDDEFGPSMRIVTESGVSIGGIGRGVKSDLSLGFPLGYSLNASYRGHGIMARALEVFVRECSRHCFQAVVLESNVASQRSLLNAGFDKIGEYNPDGETRFIYEFVKPVTANVA